MQCSLAKMQGLGSLGGFGALFPEVRDLLLSDLIVPRRGKLALQLRDALMTLLCMFLVPLKPLLQLCNAIKLKSISGSVSQGSLLCR